MKALRKLAVAALAGCALAWAPVALAEEDEGGASIPEGMTEVELELPTPVYGGTPLDYWGENLEPPSFKPRPPIVVPEGASNVAEGKSVTASSDLNYGELEMIVDGDKEAAQSSVVELKEGHQYVQIDLGQPHEVYAIAVWHFHSAERVYFDVAIKLADDAQFTEDVKTVFNNDHNNSSGIGVGDDKEYIESYKGKVIRIAEGVEGQYVRLYSSGNTSDDMNHYIEVEVYGAPVAK